MLCFGVEFGFFCVVVGDLCVELDGEFLCEYEGGDG